MSCPAQDGGLSKSIKYYILRQVYARSRGDALSYSRIFRPDLCFWETTLLSSNIAQCIMIGTTMNIPISMCDHSELRGAIMSCLGVQFILTKVE